MPLEVGAVAFGAFVGAVARTAAEYLFQNYAVLTRNKTCSKFYWKTPDL